MRLLDADILSYGLYDESPAHPYAWKLLRRGLGGAGAPRDADDYP